MTTLRTRADSSPAEPERSADAPALGDRALDLHPQVALRPEPFGALAYHYDTRRLVFLKHPDVVRVVRELANHPTVADTLTSCGITPDRRQAFERALESLIDSEMLHDRPR
ncbi:mycofactocin biosynthesis chaperone MftB [Ilumatobacter sp.]|uniref:mycofactocin biosynthesis chaperone MftB n=1 Tax=Ilumatobacter sp. TaxID=1967498 RepID=UPI003AF51CC9